MIAVFLLIVAMLVMIILLSWLKSKDEKIGDLLLRLGQKRHKPHTPAIKWSHR